VIRNSIAKVALKLLPGSLPITKSAWAFIREAKAASSLNHPNIITIHEIGRRMAHTSLRLSSSTGKHQETHGATRMQLPDILDVSIQTPARLEAAHAAGLVHRDIKPDNSW